MKFTLRELFFIIALVAMACGWWLDHRRIESRNRELNAAMRELGQTMEAHGFPFNVDPKTGQTSWSFAPFHFPQR
jgi:UDP-N-acetylmuramyl pentapeptide phosphotransferase/UDP-N-acetylglucosamine-1-phosphate transferase